MWIYMCTCVRERERERERVCVCVCVVSLCSPGWPWTHSPPASMSWVPGLQASTTIPQLTNKYVLNECVFYVHCKNWGVELLFFKKMNTNPKIRDNCGHIFVSLPPGSFVCESPVHKLAAILFSYKAMLSYWILLNVYSHNSKFFRNFTLMALLRILSFREKQFIQIFSAIGF
jgi:hypothetical protein